MRALPSPRTTLFARLTFFALPLFAVFALCLASLPHSAVKAQSDANADAKENVAQAPQVYRQQYDFTGDNKTDFANLIVPAAGSPITWNILRNPAPAGPGAAFIRRFDFGISGDAITAGNYIGDSKAEASVFRGTAGTYFHLPFPESGAATTFTAVLWGNTDGFDNAGRVGDYDGDGKDDETTVRLVGGVITWFIKGSLGTNRQVQFGRTAAGFNATLVFQGADFNNDGRDELVFCTASTATGNNVWWIGDSITGAVIKGGFRWGNFITDYFLSPDDYTGDGIADLAVARMGGAGTDAGTWYIFNGATHTLVTPAPVFGIADPNFTNEDVPIRGDYDGDGRSDVAVYRRSTATYFWLKSSDGIIGAQQHGVANDTTELPLAAFFNF